MKLEVAMQFLILRAYWKLICFDLYLARGDLDKMLAQLKAAAQ